VHAAAGAGQHRQERRRHQHLPRPRQRAGRHRRGPQPDSCPATTAWRRLLEALRQVWGVDFEWIKKQYASRR
jgi:hypothetical protein